MPKIDTTGTETVLGSLISVFRDYGFEGASLTRFTQTSGLIKASLYHRFPEGKEQMAIAALTEVDRIFATHVLAPVDAAGAPAERLRVVMKRLDEFYEGGGRGCLLETLSGTGTPSSVRAHVRRTLDFWTSKFAHISRESGCSAVQATSRAVDAVAAIEGGLVVSRAQGNNKSFKKALASLPDRLLCSEAVRPR